jgi:uracil phosphoribosyltransferase
MLLTLPVQFSMVVIQLVLHALSILLVVCRFIVPGLGDAGDRSFGT